MLTSFFRVIKSGWQGFKRNRWLSISSIAMMSLTIFGITSLLLANILIDSVIVSLEDKIDVSVYFNLETPEEKILEVKEDVSELSEVRSVEYVSADEALKRFRDKHRENQVLMQSLRELDNNPLEPSLNIKTQTASQYEKVAGFFNNGKYQDIIDKVNYTENKAVIDKLASITQTVRQSGFIVLLILAILAILVTFNTICLTIYNSRKEIRVMKLVGANNWFVRGPFVIEGAFYGIVAAVITLIVISPVLWYISPKISTYISGIDLFQFYRANFFSLFLLQIAIGVALGAISSYIAIRRHLKV